MVKSELATDKGEQTRKQIFSSALELFRERGFDGTTMQAIAAHAGVVKSAAYYYFPSKEALIQAYYENVQAEQERLCGELFTTTKDLKTRLIAALHSKFGFPCAVIPMFRFGFEAGYRGSGEVCQAPFFAHDSGVKECIALYSPISLTRATDGMVSARRSRS